MVIIGILKKIVKHFLVRFSISLPKTSLDNSSRTSISSTFPFLPSSSTSLVNLIERKAQDEYRALPEKLDLCLSIAKGQGFFFIYSEVVYFGVD
jgi:hypothetical protein